MDIHQAGKEMVGQLITIKEMEGLAILYTIVAVIVGSIYAWTFTKSGKRWLKNL